MTMDDPFDPLDELVSAYLDGEATPDERARVEADPALLARVAAMARVSDSLRDVEIDPTERESALAAAMAAFDTPTAIDEPSVIAAAPVGPPTDLAAQRARRAERSRRTGRVVGWLGAAAAIGLAVVAMNGSLGSDDNESATEPAADAAATEFDASVAAESAGSADTLASIEAGGAETADQSASETTAAAAEDEFAATMAALSFETPEELATYVLGAASESRLAPLPPDPAATLGPVERYCTLPGGVPSVALGPVLWQGVPGELLVSPDAVAPVRAVVLSADCRGNLVTVELNAG